MRGSLFKNICNAIKTKKKFLIFGLDYNTKDGTCVRDYIDINDLSRLHLISHSHIRKKNKSIIVNCGYNKPVTVLDILNSFEKILRNKISKKTMKRRSGDVEKIYCDNSYQKKIFSNFKRKYTLEESVLNTLKWEKILK